MQIIEEDNSHSYIAGITATAIMGHRQMNIVQGPVAQSIVSLTSSLRGQLLKCFTTL